MQIAQLGFMGNAQVERDLFLIIGDSNGDGRGSTIPTIPSETLYNWNGSAFDEITTQTVANDGSYGSAWQQMAVNFRNSFGRPVYIVNKCSGGSEFYPNGDNNNWYTSGTLYSPAVTAANAAKTALAITRLSVIVCLGINDIRGAQTTGNIQTAMASLMTRLNSDFSTPEIYIIMPGRDDITGYNGSRHQVVRRLLMNHATDANIHIVAQMLPLANWSLYDVDNLHLTQTGYNLLGAQIARYFIHSSYAKETRSILASFKNDVSAAVKSAINTFVTSFTSFYATVDSFYILVGSDADNKKVDWGLLSAPQFISVTDATAGVTTAGTSSSYIRTNLFHDLQSTTRSTVTDFAEFVKTGTVTTSGATSAFLFGKSQSGVSLRIYQGGSALNVQAYDAGGDSNGAETKFADNAVYAIARNGTNKMMKKDSSDVISVTVASTGNVNSRDSMIGTINASGTPSATAIQAQFKCYGILQLSDVTWSTFVTNLNTLLTTMEAS